MTTADEPVILGLVRDLLFGVRIEEAARAQGYRMVWLQPGEDAAARIVVLQPGLFVVEMAGGEPEWEAQIARIKSNAATRRVPVIAFGPHVDVAAAERARRAGADEVLPRGRFVTALPELIAERARVLRPAERAALADQCGEPLPAQALRGLEEFNRGEYFECHETLEHVWMADPRPVRDLYRAVLQVAVAYHHVARGNLPGALKMFDRSKQWFRRLPERCQGVELGRLLANAEQVEAAARQALAEGGSVDPSLLGPVYYDGHSSQET